MSWSKPLPDALMVSYRGEAVVGSEGTVALLAGDLEESTGADPWSGLAGGTYHRYHFTKQDLLLYLVDGESFVALWPTADAPIPKTAAEELIPGGITDTDVEPCPTHSSFDHGYVYLVPSSLLTATYLDGSAVRWGDPWYGVGEGWTGTGVDLDDDPPIPTAVPLYRTPDIAAGWAFQKLGPGGTTTEGYTDFWVKHTHIDVVALPAVAGGGYLMLLARWRLHTESGTPTLEELNLAFRDPSVGQANLITDIIGFWCASPTFDDDTLVGPILMVSDLEALPDQAFRCFLGTPKAVVMAGPQGESTALYVYYSLDALVEADDKLTSLTGWSTTDSDGRPYAADSELSRAVEAWGVDHDDDRFSSQGFKGTAVKRIELSDLKYRIRTWKTGAEGDLDVLGAVDGLLLGPCWLWMAVEGATSRTVQTLGGAADELVAALAPAGTDLHPYEAFPVDVAPALCAEDEEDQGSASSGLSVFAALRPRIETFKEYSGEKPRYADGPVFHGQTQGVDAAGAFGIWRLAAVDDRYTLKLEDGTTIRAAWPLHFIAHAWTDMGSRVGDVDRLAASWYDASEPGRHETWADPEPVYSAVLDNWIVVAPGAGFGLNWASRQGDLGFILGDEEDGCREWTEAWS